MEQHSVTVVNETAVSSLKFSDRYNVSMALVDRHLTEGRGGKVALQWADKELTYEDLAERVGRMAFALRQLGIGRGDRVMMVVTDEPAFYAAFLGTVRIGAVAVLVSTFIKEKDYAYILSEAQVDALVASPATFPELSPAVEGFEDELPVKIATREAPEGWVDLERLLEEAEPSSPAEPTSADDECFWLYSSGSTGAPKACVHQHKDLICTAIRYAEGILGLSESDRIFSIGKLFFAYGINNSLGFTLWAGATAILLEERPDAENTLDLMTRFKPTIYFTVPTMLAYQCAAIEGSFDCELSSLRACVCGGEPLPPSLFDRWKNLTGHSLIEGIGSSEALHIYISNDLDNPRTDTAGRAVRGYQAKVVNEHGDECASGEIGELIISGESLSTHYWNKPEKTAQCMRDGWFYTGDSVYQDEDGYFHFCGRRDDMLRVGGLWVSPSEIEAALTAHASVQEAAVVGLPDANGLIKPKAFVVLRDVSRASETLERELIGFVKDHLAKYKYPHSIEFVADLPKTATGKIRRFQLRAASGVSPAAAQNRS